MSSGDVLKRVREAGIIPTLRTGDPKRAVLAAEAILSGGIAVLEVSFAIPGANKALEAVSLALGSQMIVGAGTVVDEKSARLAIDSGAVFIVTPGFSAEAVQVCKEANAASFAGALTPTEVQLAWTCTPTAVKLFPCNAVGGPRYVKAIRGQYPDVELIASGGITLANCAEYFQAGACAIGVGGEIADADSMTNGHQRVFTERARRFRKVVQEAQARWCAA